MKNTPILPSLLAFSLLLAPTAQADDDLFSPFPFQQGQIHGRDVTLGATQISSSIAGRDMNLNGTILNGPASAGRDIHAQGCGGNPVFTAGRDLQLNHCDSVMSATAARNLELASVQVTRDIISGGNLSLRNAIILGNAKAAGNVSLDDAEIKGSLHIATPYLLVNHSKLGPIRVSQPQFSYNQVSYNANGNGIVVGSGNIMSSGGNSIVSSGGSSVVSTNGEMVISVREHSTSSVNGYTIQGGSGQTTVITPDGTVYVNGSQVSGNGPKTYAEYKNQAPNAPTIVGPGWQDAGSSANPSPKSQASAPQQVIELKNNSSVVGAIVFEGGHGKVIIHRSATFQGQVEGGTIEHVASD